MPATSWTVRLLSAALAVAVAAVLVTAKVHFNDEITRLTMKHDAIVLPVVEVVAERPAHVAAMSEAAREN